MAQAVRRSLLVWEVWGSYPESIKSPTRCQRLATAATFKVWTLAHSREEGHRSLVTPERVLSEYNEELIYFFLILINEHFDSMRGLATSKIRQYNYHYCFALVYLICSYIYLKPYDPILEVAEQS